MESKISSITTASYKPTAFVRPETQKSKGGLDDVSKQDKLDNAEAKNKPSEAKAKVTSLKEAKELAEEVNKLPANTQRDLHFKVDDATNQVVMSIVDKATGEIIKQLPSEEALELLRRMQKGDEDPGGILEDKV